jgi:hypothetical protein
MKTITVKGKVYEVDTLYFCTEKDRFGYVSGNVRTVSAPQIEMNNTDFTWYSRSLEVVEPELIGAIKDAPIELERGEWYMCSDSNGVKRVGYFDGAVMTDGLNHFGDSCLNPLRRDTYTPLYKMVKAYAVGVECENYKQI